MQRTMIDETVKKVGKKVTVKGFVDNIRNHGRVIFLEIRDISGILQVVGDDRLKSIDNQDVIELRGSITQRPDEMINHEMPTGKVEMMAEDWKILGKSRELPFPIDNDGRQINEEIRLEYRYLDLRRERLSRNIRLRSEFVRKCRDYLYAKNFCEIETPYLTASTKEGSRDFLVPSRLQPGKFFALPQSPQQYKQLLMAAGFEKYFQIARCFRDEDLRADRGFEHTQIDIEMSFVSRDEFMALDEEMIEGVVKSLGYEIKQKPFPRISYQEAMEKYGSDKFDLRTEEDKNNGVLAFAWVIDFPFFKKVDKEDKAEMADSKSGWTFTHNPFSMPDEANLADHLAGKNIEKIKTQQYDLVCNGYEVGGGSIRANDPAILEATYKIMGYSDEEIQTAIGHMLKAFSYGAPPHGGIAHGVERMVMIMAKEEALREVVAFPQTASGTASVTRAPTEIEDEQLKEMGIKVRGSEDAGLLVNSDIFGKICAWLNNEKVNYQSYFHSQVNTSQEAAEELGLGLEHGVKSLIVNADGEKIMAVIPANQKLNLGAIKQMGYKDVSLISLDELRQITGLKPGAIPPFGSLFGLKTLADNQIKSLGKIFFSAGSNQKSIEINGADFVRMERASLADLGK